MVVALGFACLDCELPLLKNTGFPLSPPTGQPALFLPISLRFLILKVLSYKNKFLGYVKVCIYT